MNNNNNNKKTKFIYCNSCNGNLRDRSSCTKQCFKNNSKDGCPNGDNCHFIHSSKNLRCDYCEGNVYEPHSCIRVCSHEKIGERCKYDSKCHQLHIDDLKKMIGKHVIMICKNQYEYDCIDRQSGILEKIYSRSFPTLILFTSNITKEKQIKNHVISNFRLKELEVKGLYFDDFHYNNHTYSGSRHIQVNNKYMSDEGKNLLKLISKEWEKNKDSLIEHRCKEESFKNSNETTEMTYYSIFPFSYNRTKIIPLEFIVSYGEKYSTDVTELVQFSEIFYNINEIPRIDHMDIDISDIHKIMVIEENNLSKYLAHFNIFLSLFRDTQGRDDFQELLSKSNMLKESLEYIHKLMHSKTKQNYDDVDE
jgi:hypothetical protein